MAVLSKFKPYLHNKVVQNIVCVCFAAFALAGYSVSGMAHGSLFDYCGSPPHIAQDLSGIGTCNCIDTFLAKTNGLAPFNVVQNHEDGETDILRHMREQFHLHREWFVRDYIFNLWPKTLMLMAEQMSNVAMYQMMIVGEFYDAKLQLETQLLFNELQNEAAKDYQPSDSFCYFGTNVRSLSSSESLAMANQASLNQIGLSRNLGNSNNSAVSGDGSKDWRARWDMFVTQYCDPRDNNWRGGTSGLVDVCGTGAANAERMNKDIDFGRVLGVSRYLDVNFNDNNFTEDEADVISLAKNLYGHEPPPGMIRFMSRSSVQHLYLQLRSVIAKRNVAQNSFNALVAMKAVGSAGGNSPPFFHALVRDLGMNVTEIEEIFGENPSYYAQLEAVGKKMFQNTDFFTDLLDKPMNVKRKQAAVNAIELMLDRAIYESELRHEMLLSVLLSSYLEDDKEEEFRNFVYLGE
ncbi:MAG: hypothetical protein CMH27_09645 [Micavibrio sp.]|nr:hypothetical protein [Micavibrio sp.]